MKGNPDNPWRSGFRYRGVANWIDASPLSPGPDNLTTSGTHGRKARSTGRGDERGTQKFTRMPKSERVKGEGGYEGVLMKQKGE